jgi:anti-sigma factor (TIGR02949 family)
MSEYNCNDTLGKVFDFLGHELEEADRTKVLDHLEGCQACKKEYAIESKISKIISSSSIEAQTSFASKLQSRIQSEI